MASCRLRTSRLHRNAMAGSQLRPAGKNPRSLRAKYSLWNQILASGFWTARVHPTASAMPVGEAGSWSGSNHQRNSDESPCFHDYPDPMQRLH